jgi:hypothetical protein
MNVRRRIPLDGILATVLPDCSGTSSTGGHGLWTTGSGQAEWVLEPDQEGFWLLLLGDLGAGGSLAETLVSGAPWPWPLKHVRHQPGAPLRWCAELRLVGAPEEAAALRELVRRLGRWLSADSAALPIETHQAGQSHELSRFDERLPLEMAGAQAAAEVLTRVLGNGLKPSPRGYRFAPEEGPVVWITPDHGWWTFRTTLSRPPAALAPAALGCLHDFLAVANRRLHGYRARLDAGAAGSGPGAVLEACIALECLTVESIRTTTTGLTRSAQLLAPSCQVVIEQPRLGELYGRFLLGGDAAATTSASEVSCSLLP